jgi:hypothetical protein
VQLSGRTIWLACYADLFEAAVIDEATGGSPHAWRGDYLQFKTAIFFDDAPFDLANIQSLTLEVFASTRLGNALMSRTVDAGSITATITTEQWTAKSHCNATFDFTDAETLLDLASGKSKAFWLVLTGVTSDAPGRSITLGAGAFTLHEPGPDNAELVAAQPPGAYTPAQSDVRYVQKWENNANMRWVNGSWYYWFVEDSKWRRQVPALINGVPTMGWEELA